MRERRAAKGLSQAELALRLDVSRQTINSIETDRYTPSLPLAIGVFLGSYRPDLVEPMFETAYGYLLVAAVVLLQGAGFLTIRRVVSVDV